jgi:hypothetical protein
MRIVAALRDGPNLTNVRTEGLIAGLEEHGHSVTRCGRGEIVEGADLLIQTGFAGSNALLSQIGSGKPYIVMEAPFWRDYYDAHAASSWGYNGLAGGAFAPSPPDEERPKPELMPVKAGTGPTIIIGQKPTDHSLRGSNHVEWILNVKAELPEADFRPHPLMVPPNSLEPISSILERYKTVVTFTSTVGCEALVAGCEVRADGRESLAYGVGEQSRPRWHHDLSWRQAENFGFGALVPYILSGYDEARALAEEGKMEVPRAKVNNISIQQAYNKLVG